MDFGSTVCIFRVKERCLAHTALDNNSRLFPGTKSHLSIDTISRRLKRHKIQWSNWELILEHYILLEQQQTDSVIWYATVTENMAKSTLNKSQIWNSRYSILLITKENPRFRLKFYTTPKYLATMNFKISQDFPRFHKISQENRK